MGTLITGGGTGGHVYPALSIIRYLMQEAPEEPGEDRRREVNGRAALRSAGHSPTPGDGLLYVGNSRTMERTLVPRAGIRCYFFPMASPSSPRGMILLVLATLRSLAVILRNRPRATLATGGYVSTPVSVASWLLRVPVILFSPDVVPGKAVKSLAPLARRIAVGTDTSLQYFPTGKAAVTGYPVREFFLAASREAGRKHFGIPHDARVLFVTGGSQGSRSINTSVTHWLPRLLQRFHVIHVAGEARYGEALEAVAGLSDDQLKRYHLVPYLHDAHMANGMAAADLVLCRSGASTIGELPAVGVPGVLVPLPEPAVHQRENAEYLERHGAAIILEDSELMPTLGPILDELLSDAKRLAAMADACRKLARPDAAQAIAEIVAQVAA